MRSCRSYVLVFLPACDQRNHQSFKEATCPFAEWHDRERKLPLAGYSGSNNRRGFQVVDCNRLISRPTVAITLWQPCQTTCLSVLSSLVGGRWPLQVTVSLPAPAQVSIPVMAVMAPSLWLQHVHISRTLLQLSAIQHSPSSCYVVVTANTTVSTPALE